MHTFTRWSAAAVALGLCASMAAAKSPAQWQQLAAQAQWSLPQAIEKAVQAVPGTVIEASLEKAEGPAPAHYEVELVTPAGDNVEVWIDAATGQAINQKHDGKAKRKDMQRIESATATITQAIQAATAHTAGTPIKAELDSHWGNTSYEVEVLQANGHIVEVKINAADAQVLRAKPD